MCGALTAEELTTLARSTRKSQHSPGDMVSGAGEAIDSYANVMRGVVKLTKGLEDGRQQVVGLKFAPDLLGRLFGETNEVNAEAASDVELCVVPRSTLETMVTGTPALEHRLLRQSLAELDEARDWMLTLGRKTAAEKVASFLLLIATHTDPEHDTADAAAFDLPLSRGDIADYLGLTIETVSRQLTALRQAGVVGVEGRHITVPDLEALRELAG